MPLDYAPDLNRFQKGMLRAVLSLIPTVNGTYVPGPGPNYENYGTPLANNDVIGSAVVKNAAGTALLYAGTTGKLWQSNGTTGWTDRSGAAYTTAATGTWSFAQFSDKTLAANGADKIQVATGAAFADLAAAAPTAKIVIIHENAALAFNTTGNPDGWFRSDTGDVTNWTAAASNDVDSGVLRGDSGGPIVAATVYGPLAIAWKKNAMYSGIYNNGTGGAADPKIKWDYVPGGTSIGCVGQNAHISTDVGLFFVSDRDIMLFDGGKPRSIGKKVRRNFFKNAVSRSQIFMTHNEVERNVFIWYCTSGTYPTQALVYNYESGLWGELSYISAVGTINDYVRCPVRNANYTDYSSVTGIAVNTGLEANVVWLSPHAATGARLVNFAASTSQQTADGTGAAIGPFLTTGYIGNPEVDTTWSRVIQVGGTKQTPTLLSGAVTAYSDATLANVSVNGIALSVGPDGAGDFTAEGRYLLLTLTWAASANNGNNREIGDLIYQGIGGGNR